MCLAIPAQILEITGPGRARAEVEGVTKEISVDLVDGVGPGDYVIVHVGYALARLDPDEAEKTLALFRSEGEEPVAAQ